MAGLQGLLGETVSGKDGAVQVNSLASEGAVVGLYFSAHWCPPCRSFTPQLGQWYKDFKTTENGSKLEIVFVSSDRDDNAFKEYYEEMPWLALPYDRRDEKAKLSKKFKVQGIPTLVFVEANTGSLITKNGRAVVGSDPKGAKFPWRPKALNEMLKGNVLTKDGEKELADVIKGKVLGIYFSAHWCGPCRGFTPKLCETYQKIKDARKNLEILFVSSDLDENSFDSYYQEMPWLALPYEDERKEELEAHFEMAGIPTLIILDEKLDLITEEGRGAISCDPEGQKFPWIPTPLQELTQVNASLLNDRKTLIYFTGAEDDVIRKGQELLKDVAEQCVKEQQDSKGTANELEPILICYEGKETGELSASLRDFMHLEQSAPCLVYLSIDDGVKYIWDKPDLTQEDVKDIIGKIREENLETVPLRE